MMAAGVPPFSLVVWKNTMLLATSAVCVTMVVLNGLAMESNNDHVEYVLLWINFVLTALGVLVWVHSNTGNAESRVVPLLVAWMMLGAYGVRYAVLVEHRDTMTDTVGITLILNFVCPSGLLLSWLLILM